MAKSKRDLGVSRVLRVWIVKFPGNDDNQKQFLEALLMDKSGCKIHCVVKQKFIPHYQHLLKEGQIFSLRRFTVIPNTGYLKFIRHRYKLLLNLQTEIEPVVDVQFPTISYSLCSVRDIVHLKEESPYLIDMMGFLISVQECSPVQFDDGTTFGLRIVEVYANESYVRCHLCGDFFRFLENVIRNAEDQAPIILLESFKVRVATCFVALQNVINCSNVLVNPDLVQTKEFIYGLDPLGPCYTGCLTSNGDMLALAIDDDFVLPSKSITIHELRKNQKAGFYTVVGIIKGICNKFNWWCYCCPCGLPLKLIRNVVTCLKCKRNITHPIQRFKLMLDVEDFTGHSMFVLFDRATSLLLRKRVLDTLADFKNDYPVNHIPPYPPSFENVIGMEVVFRTEKKTSNYYDLNEFYKRPQAHDEVSSLGNRLSISHDIIESIEIDVDALCASYDMPKLDPYTFFVGIVRSICYDKGWWYWICLCGEKYEGNDLIPFCQGCLTHCYDGILRYRVTIVLADTESEQMLVLHDRDVANLMKEECCNLSKKHESFLLGDLLRLDGSDLSSKLFGKKLVFMIDPFAIEADPSSIIYNVFRGSEGVLGENKFVSQYDRLPSSVKDTLNNEFNHWLEMQHQEYDSANDESSNDDNDWAIRVKIICIWEESTLSEEGEYKVLLMILMDGNLDKIQATTGNVDINGFSDILKEKGVYLITNFTVIPNAGRTRITKHRSQLFSIMIHPSLVAQVHKLLTMV
ncbi:hypothetical protein PIB30_018298 [Stylosanthes scabra]|uniref:Replication protein A 70 kDa DNA-binding subunit B/D first OB fold domain-containing protein n=1 Tax=Stylosanthes scabra TaxID=79078 RepID=A0ABU6Y6H3_9FABA|nr:hypothetical protein [Stylosanthes scabra]